jgi:predicted O-methyltransferase YrrM
MSASCHSFESILQKWIQKIQPFVILEWGPGRSTEIMCETCPGASITSIENQKSFAEKASKALPSVRVVHAAIPEYGPSQYPCWPLLNAIDVKYDLIFVDGRQRVSCLLTSLKVLNKNGVVILHDAQRPHYKHGIELFDKVDDDGDTVVLKIKQI